MRSVPFFSTLQRATTCKRLWMGGGMIAAFLLTMTVGNQFIAADRSVTRQMLGHDFLAFYTAGSFVRQGRARELYNLDSVRDFEQSTAHAANLEVGKSFGPWWNPPFYALVFEPLAAMPYGRALDLWRWISVAAVLMAIAILTSFVAATPVSPPGFLAETGDASGAGGTRASRPWNLRQAGLVPLLLVVSMPFVQSISHGQNTFTSLLLLTITVALWRWENKFTAGLICGMLFYKPQLGAVVAVAMLLDLGWKSLAGLSITGTVLLLINLLALPGSLGDWLHQLPANVRNMQVEHAYLWERHVTLKAFWRLLLQGREAGEPTALTTVVTFLSLLTVGAGLLITMLRLRGAEFAELRPLYRDRLIAATITAMPLLMPFYFDYDLLLLAVPITLYAVERIARPECSHAKDRQFTTGWAILFLWLYFNPAIALHTHVNITVLLLSSVTFMSIKRANRLQGAAAPITVLRPQRVAMAA